MRAFLAGLALFAATAIAPAAHAQNQPGPTLKAILAKGTVDCSVSPITPGFSYPDAKGEFQGMDVDVCRAIAAAVFGDPGKAKFIPVNGAQRLPSLQSGQVDVVVQTLTQTQTREAANGLLFAGTNFYDGQGFLVRKSANIKTAKDLAGAAICVSSGSTSELNLQDWMSANKIEYRPVVFEQVAEGRAAYDAGRCDAYSTDSTQLLGMRFAMRNPDEHVVLPDIISKEPLGAAVRQGDDQWYLIVKWVMSALVEAEEQGITQANVDEKLNATAPTVKRLLGTTGDYGKFMALDNKWAYWAIKAVGNYGEMFERHLGQGSQIKLQRGRNDLWTRGGLMYSAPIR
jgi:general L-amino acid transport system substrate-binding protein